MKKRVLSVIGILLLIAAVVVIMNIGKIQRLLLVNALFEEDNIVHNFSNMDALMFTHPHPISAEPYVWREAAQALPQTVIIDGEPRALEPWLEEASTTALVIVHGDDIIFEDYYKGTGAEERRISWSMAKSFLSALVGTAVERGEIKSLDVQVTDYVPALKGSAYDGASLRNVLNMSSGVAFNEDYLDSGSDINKMGRVLALGGSMDDFAAGINVRARTPGSARQYVSIDTHVIGMVLRAATGKTVHELYDERLWSQIGFGADSFYMTDGGDRAFVLGGLNMRTRDYALFGKVMRDGGVYNGKSIIPAAWVTESTANNAPASAAGSHNDASVGYGYQWWVPPASEDAGFQGDFFAVGIYGQYIYVNPALDIVIAKNAAHREFMSPAASGKGYMMENIDVFRSLAKYYAAKDPAAEDLTAKD